MSRNIKLRDMKSIEPKIGEYGLRAESDKTFIGATQLLQRIYERSGISGLMYIPASKAKNIKVF